MTFQTKLQEIFPESKINSKKDFIQLNTKNEIDFIIYEKCKTTMLNSSDYNDIRIKRSGRGIRIRFCVNPSAIPYIEVQ